MKTCVANYTKSCGHFNVIAIYFRAVYAKTYPPPATSRLIYCSLHFSNVSKIYYNSLSFPLFFDIAQHMLSIEQIDRHGSPIFGDEHPLPSK